VIKPFWVEFGVIVILSVVFGVLIPWEDHSGLRSWTQQSEGRAVIQTIRIFNEIIIVYFIAWVLWKGKVSMNFLILSIGVTASIGVMVAIYDFFNDYVILENVAVLREDLVGRFIGFNGEPKGLGRNSAVSYGILLVYYLTREKDTRILFILAILALGVVLSLSASSYILFVAVNVIIFIVYVRNSRRSISVIGIVIVLIVGEIVRINYFPSTTTLKIEKALYGEEDIIVKNEPRVFTRFDIFDRLALNFLYNNPIYILTGTGPNMISIPASIYIPKNSWAFKERRIDSVPNVLIINIIARSGLIGFSILFIGLYRFYLLSKLDKSGFQMGIFIVSLLFSFVMFNTVLYFYLGIILGEFLRLKKITNLDN